MLFRCDVRYVLLVIVLLVYSVLSFISYLTIRVFCGLWIGRVLFIDGSKGTEKPGRHIWYQSLGLVNT